MGILCSAIIISILFFSGFNCAKILLNPNGLICNSRIRNVERLGVILSENGHDVTMIMPDMCRHLKTSNKISFIDLPVNERVSDWSASRVSDVLIHQPASGMLLFLDLIGEYCECMLRHPTFIESLKAENFDLMLYDEADLCAQFLQPILKVKLVGYNNFGVIDSPATLPYQIATYPNVFTPYTDVMTFHQRVVGALITLSQFLMYHWRIAPRIRSLAEQYSVPCHWDTSSLAQQMSVLFLNIDLSVEFPRALPPNVVPIGGIFARPPKPLSQDLEAFMQDSPHGVVVVAFGTNDFTLSAERLHVFNEAFKGLPQRVVWKHNGELPSNLTLAPNVKVMSWLPQNDLLGHPKTRMFVSHCGVSSLHEISYHGVPIVALPTLGDQPHNAALLVKRAKIGRQLRLWEMTSHDLVEAMNDVINGAHYRTNAQRLATRYRKQMVSPKEKFLYWINASLEDDLTYLQNNASRLYWFQIYLLDVWLVLGLTTAPCCYMLKKGVSLIWSLMRCHTVFKDKCE